MIDRGKHNLLGVMVDAVDYDAAVARITGAAHARRCLSVTALAVHGVMSGYSDDAHRARLNRFDLVVPDGQPVRWALNALHGTALDDRVYGPELTLRVLEAAAREGLGVYLYGSTARVLGNLMDRLLERLPTLVISGAEPSRFRRLDASEKREVVDRIRDSGAAITLVGLGCPRQEVWAHEYRDALAMPVLAVGAAFDFHAGTLPQAPAWMQARGLEWAFRLRQEPTRLWRRYLLLNPWYLALVAGQRTGLRRFAPDDDASVSVPELSYG